MASVAQIKASVKYNKSKDSITLRPAREEGAQIRADAASAGQNVQQYILQACRERRARDNTNNSDG